MWFTIYRSYDSKKLWAQVISSYNHVKINSMQSNLHVLARSQRVKSNLELGWRCWNFLDRSFIGLTSELTFQVVMLQYSSYSHSCWWLRSTLGQGHKMAKSYYCIFVELASKLIAQVATMQKLAHAMKITLFTRSQPFDAN